MNDMALFIIFFGFVILQRLIELLIAARNENWMKKQGAIEFGDRHYPVIVWMHVLFLACFIIEKTAFNRGLSYLWPAWLTIFLLVQGLRIWAIGSLGRYWNTKILVLPNAQVIRGGPYKFIKHPNYLVVVIELLVIPAMFSAYGTACIFSLLNACLLVFRIKEEERSLKQFTAYEEAFHACNRFVPKIGK